MQRRHKSREYYDGGNEAEWINDSYVDTSTSRPRIRRFTQSSNAILHDEIHVSPRQRAHSTYGLETRTPNDYSSQERPKIVHKVLHVPSPKSERPGASSKKDRGQRYDQSHIKRSKSAEPENLQAHAYILREAERRPTREDPLMSPTESESSVYYNIRRKEREHVPDEPESQYERMYERDSRKEVKEDIRRESRDSVRRASSNLRQYSTGDSHRGGDPRRYMELKYGVLIDATEKTLEEVEDETAFIAEIDKKESEVFERYSSSHRYEPRFSRLKPERRSHYVKPETLLFSEPLDLSDSDSEGASDEQVKQILDAVISSQNLTIPEEEYEPQTEAFKEERNPHMRKASANIDEMRVHSIQDRERSIHERERSLRSREESMREREAALEDRERRAQEEPSREEPSRRRRYQPSQASGVRDDASGYERPRHPGYPHYSSDEDSHIVG